MRHNGPFDWLYKTKQWGLIRSVALARDHYLCQRCLENGLLTPAEMVHHVEPVETHPWLAFVLDNLLSLCNACHNSVHRKGKTHVQKPRRKVRARVEKV